MKICRIVYEMPPPWDGLAPHPYEITQAQSKKGYDITIFCGRWPKAGPVEQIKNVKYVHVPREPFPATISFTSSVILFFKYIFWRRRNRPDILHCHGHFAIWIYLYRNMLVKFFPWSDELKIPLVVHFHNTAKGRWESFVKEGKYISPHSKYIQWPLSVFSDKLAAKAAAACIFVSNDTKEEALKFYKVDPRRCFVVETGVNTALFLPVGEQEREKSRKEMDLDIFDKVILNLGMMVERKNIHLLIEALAFLPQQYKLVLVGNWDSSYQQKVLEKIGKSGVENRVIRVGYTPYPLNPIAYQMSDVFVLPSSWEGLPKAVMQALACGKPAIVSGFKLQDDITGIFYLENLEPQTIANKILEVVESDVKVDVQKVYLKYSWDEKIKEIDRVYDFAQKTAFYNLLTTYKLPALLLLFIVIHLTLFNVNVAEWGDSYRILRASEFIRTGTYPADEKRQPLLSLVIALRPNFIDPITFGRIALFAFSLASFILFYFFLKQFTKNEKWIVWGMLAFLFNNVYLYWSIRIMTDVPFGFFVLLAIYCYQKWKDSLSTRNLMLLSLICGLAVLTRFEGYLLTAAIFGGVAFDKFKPDFAAIKVKLGRLLIAAIPLIIVVGPWLYLRNPLTSSYFEEPASRQYGIKMLLTYFVSLVEIFGILPAFYILSLSYKDIFKKSLTNLPMIFYVVMELILILSWPAAVPRLFVPIIPFLLLALVLSFQNYFEEKSFAKTPVRDLLLGGIFIIVYIGLQFYLKLQFLILDRRIFVVNLVLQIILLLVIAFKKRTWLVVVSTMAMLLWSVTIIDMHRNIFISVKSASLYAAQNFTGNIGYNDISSVSDWYINYQYKRAETRGFYYNTEKKQYLEQPPLKANKIDYLLITNEHNTTMTLDLNKRPYLKELKVFEYVVNGQRFVTRLVKVL